MWLQMILINIFQFLIYKTMAALLSIDKTGSLLVSETAKEKFNLKGLGTLAVSIATKIVVKWSKPLIVSLIVALIHEAAKNSTIEDVVESVIHELDKDSDGQIDDV